jgi:hypothetical protein
VSVFLSCFASLLLSSLILSFSCLSSRCGTHGFCLLMAGAGALCPRQVRRPRPDECRAPPAPGVVRRSRRPCGGPEDPGRLAGVPGGGFARPTLGARGAAHGAPLRHRAGPYGPHRPG